LIFLWNWWIFKGVGGFFMERADLSLIVRGIRWFFFDYSWSWWKFY